MDRNSLQNFSNYETGVFEEDPFLLSNQLHPLDFSGYSSFNCQWELPLEENVLQSLPLTDKFPSTDPLEFSTMDFTPSQGDSYNVWGDNFGVLDEVGGVVDQQFESDKQIVLFNNEENSGEEVHKDKEVNVCRQRKTVSSCNEISRKSISRYFYMPITQAAKELNIGLTLLKKRCRELGISRWPHRKLMSLQTLIKNFQEMEAAEGQTQDSKIGDVVELLEQQRKLMEEWPEVELEENTKKLRQACFKANYKRRKVQGMLEWKSSPTNSHVNFETTETSTSTSSRIEIPHTAKKPLVDHNGKQLVDDSTGDLATMLHYGSRHIDPDGNGNVPREFGGCSMRFQ
ncbi:hypothetical protein IFM89_023190 [Coptis chinensis]|uniref:RWP-RK domain-containing protein n=1 Tax=Coptis chinensis TaxID=261450 RepID=A0A835HXE7_9MAGN|nr:hypothetical protein IFM89_023190 [Coptis chinensis]